MCLVADVHNSWALCTFTAPQEICVHNLSMKEEIVHHSQSIYSRPWEMCIPQERFVHSPVNMHNHQQVLGSLHISTATSLDNMHNLQEAFLIDICKFSRLYVLHCRVPINHKVSNRISKTLMKLDSYTINNLTDSLCLASAWQGLTTSPKIYCHILWL